MAGRLECVQETLRAHLGGELLARCPELPYAVDRLLLRFTRAQEAPSLLWHAIDSALFNAVYAATGGTMLAPMPDGRAVRVSAASLTDLADRLLALAYEGKPETPALRDALFDLSRAGSFAAMRALLAFPLDAEERAVIEQVLSENGQSA